MLMLIRACDPMLCSNWGIRYFDPPAVAPYNSASYRAVNYTANFEVCRRVRA